MAHFGPSTAKIGVGIMRSAKLILGLLVVATAIPATTLVKLSLDEMISQSTDIVRARVSDCQAAQRGPAVVTDCVITVSERLKGIPATTMAVSVPGGTVSTPRGRLRHVIAGSPEFDARQEYLLFLWRGKSGITQLIGLSQGVLEVSVQNGKVVANRTKSSGVSYQDAKGEEVDDDGLTVTLDAVRRRAKEVR